jgi:urease accessory protein
MQRAAGTGRLMVSDHAGRPAIARLYQEGCAKLRFPKVRGNGPLEAVMINTAGGLTGGDRMRWQFDVASGAALSVTAQACERIYKSTGGDSHVRTNIVVGAGGHIAWLPQETILFDRAALDRRLDIDLAGGATALIVEPMLFGRSAMGEDVRHAAVRDRWRIRVDGRLVHAEDFVMHGAVASDLARGAIAGGAGAMATVAMIGPDVERLLEPVRAVLSLPVEGMGEAGASVWRVAGTGKLLARLTAEKGFGLRQRLVPLIALLNGQAGLPKIWTS